MTNLAIYLVGPLLRYWINALINLPPQFTSFVSSILQRNCDAGPKPQLPDTSVELDPKDPTGAKRAAHLLVQTRNATHGITAVGDELLYLEVSQLFGNSWQAVPPFLPLIKSGLGWNMVGSLGTEY